MFLYYHLQETNDILHRNQAHKPANLFICLFLIIWARDWHESGVLGWKTYYLISACDAPKEVILDNVSVLSFTGNRWNSSQKRRNKSDKTTNLFTCLFIKNSKLVILDNLSVLSSTGNRPVKFFTKMHKQINL